jgi:hypothetical protein
MADGSMVIVMAGGGPPDGGGVTVPLDCGVAVAHGVSMDTTCEKPDGAGLDEQKVPEVTFAGMPYWVRSRWRAAVSRSSSGLIFRVAVPLGLLVSVKAAVLMVPGLG